MERSIEQLSNDIRSLRYNFEKSKELAPVGYKFMTNHNVETDGEFIQNVEYYKSHGYIVLSHAYNMYGELVGNYVAVYGKK